MQVYEQLLLQWLHRHTQKRDSVLISVYNVYQ